MAGELQIDVDAREILRMLDVLGDRAAVAIKAACLETARSIQSEGRARLARQTAGTGKTAEAITIEDINGGFKVYVGSVSGRAENLPLWLEVGTKYMTSRPFLFASALVEEGPHLRRVSEALQDALDGLGT